MSEQTGGDLPAEDEDVDQDVDEDENRDDPVVSEDDKTPIDKAAEKVNQVLKDSSSGGSP